MSDQSQRDEGGPGTSASERLAALDQLYSEGSISASELSDGRRRILSEITGADGGPPPAIPSAPPSGDGVKTPDRLRGLPVWALGAVGGLVALVVIIGIVVWASSGHSSSSGASGKEAAYVTSIARPLDLLNRSAVVVGKQLASTSEPSDLPAMNRVAERQLDVVEEARSSLAETSTAPEDAKAQRAILRAVSEQRTYVIALSRASKGTPSQANLADANRARASGGRVLSVYKAFFALETAAPNAITGTDLTDVSGLREAITQAIADRRAKEDRAAAAARRAATPPPIVTPSTGTVRDTSAEADRIYIEIQGGDYTDVAAAERLYSQLRGSSDPVRGNAAFNAGVIRYANGDCSGAVEAFSYAASQPATAAQSAARYNALNVASEGCSGPVYDLTH